MATYKIIGQRFLRKYSAPRPTPVYSAAVDVQAIVNSLCDVPWSRTNVSDAQMAYHTDEKIGDEKISGLDLNVKIRDSFDAALFCSEHVGGMHRANANAAVYVYELPDAAVGKSLTSLKLSVVSDPYNANGARIHLMTSSTADIPASCHICRGESADGTIIDDGTTASGVAPRSEQVSNGKTYWYPSAEDCTLSPGGTLALEKYLMVFVLLESYATVRGNWIEGCSFIRNLAELSTAEDIDGWTDGETYNLTSGDTREFNVCRDGVLPLLPSSRTGLKTITLQKTGDELVAATGIAAADAVCKIDAGIASAIEELDGPIKSIDVMQPNGICYTSGSTQYWTAVQFAVITGKFSKGSFTGLPGFLIFDVWRGKFLEDIPLTGIDSNLVAAARNGQLRGGFAVATDGDSSSTTVLVWALLETGAMAKDSAVYPFAYFTIAQNSGTVSSPALLDGVAYDSTVNCHFLVQTGSEDYYLYNQCENLTVSDGVIKAPASGLSSNFPSAGVSYVGTINAIRPLCSSGDGSLKFLVSGNLTSVGGVACKNCAIVTFTSSSATVTIPAFDALITPDTYEGFSVSAQLACLTANSGGSYSWNGGTADTYLVSGAFNALGGNIKYKKAVDVTSDTLTSRTALGDVSKVIDAVATANGFVLYGQEAQNSTGMTVFDVSDLKTSVSDTQSCIGLRTLYAKFYSGELYLTASTVVGSKERIGAGFVVKTGTVAVNALNGSTYEEIEVPVWQMTLASLVVPFSIPQDYSIKSIHLSWPTLTATGGKLNIWLKRGEYIDDIPDLKNVSFYTADAPSVEGWELVGTVDPTQTEAVFEIAAMSERLASLLFTAYISLDDLNPSSSMSMPQGIATDMNVDSITGEVTGLGGNWKPDITLKG